jgi:8-oxo-dGTP pyrophosphatase MutT (NUDIX family)
MGFWAGFQKRAMREVATVAIIDVDGRKLLMGQRRDNEKWTTPGGHLEEGEKPIDGAVREVKEESGIRLGDDDLIHIKSKEIQKPGGEKLRVHAYKAFFGSDRLPKTTTRHDPDEEVHGWQWVPMAGGLPPKIRQNLHVPLGRNVLLDHLNLSMPGETLEPPAALTKKAFWQGFLKIADDFSKRPYGEREISALDPKLKGEIWTAKIDGAHTVIKLDKGEIPQLFSHRTSKKTGKPIPYNEKLPHIQRKSPFTGLLRGETYAVHRDGKAVHPDVVTALLNSGPAKSKELQERLGIKTRTALIDVDHFEGRPMANAPFSEKRKVMETIVKANPDFTLPATAVTQKAKESLLQKIMAGTHPETKEGIVVHQMETPSKFIKAKISKDHDVYVRDVFMEENTKASRPQGMAGGFRYSWEPEGPIIGKVGTGFNHDLKREMAQRPDAFIGRVAKVKALDVSKNKVLVKPSFLGWHVDKNLE